MFAIVIRSHTGRKSRYSKQKRTGNIRHCLSAGNAFSSTGSLFYIKQLKRFKTANLKNCRVRGEFCQPEKSDLVDLIISFSSRKKGSKKKKLFCSELFAGRIQNNTS